MTARIRDPQDFASGAVFIALGLAGLWFGRHLRVGTASFMEVGYVPRLTCLALIGLGAMLALRALWRAGPALAAWAWRPLAILTAAVLAFGILIERAGLIAAAVAVTWIATCAGSGLTWRQTAALTTVLTLMTLAIFHWGLALPIPLWPR